MSCENDLDPRTRLAREKYFSLRPKPLERWLWQQGVSPRAERIFWLHWEEGMKSGDWCSQVPIKRVATLCCVDTSTVTRAYQILKNLGLIRRADPGRDEANPFQQATAVTEVRVPPDLLRELGKSPNRASAPLRAGFEKPVIEAPPQLESKPPVAVPPVHCPTRQEAQAMWLRASEGEKARFFKASRIGLCRIEFDADSRLSVQDQGQIVAQLGQMARARVAAPPEPKSVHPQRMERSRKLTTLELARTRKRLSETVPSHAVLETLRQVQWAAEEGSLKRFDLPLAVNIALKKIREGAWTRPNRMPPNWLCGQNASGAHPETCSAA